MTINIFVTQGLLLFMQSAQELIDSTIQNL